MNEEGNAVAETNSLGPPFEIIAEILIDVNSLVSELRSPSLGGEDSVEEESACEEYVAGVEQLASE